ncbi:DNA mismatch repair protein PMS1 [Astathelohania contejeani]|uniref:DNA mismatch repair protein PMS1 n=1 Tax=Astathelohania contejeani TaxID=164912 RepID=A0ABQ7I0W3_9MICR|nr:DNA mismatch repair protein PMS1 [Thelohania contejeani]
MIKHLTKRSSETIKAQQCVYNYYIVIKELVENSLDAEATNIEIYFDKNDIIVIDDGVGISDLKKLGQEGCTSKYEQTRYVVGESNEYNEFTYGFRGQALHALRTVATVEITTRAQESLATKMCLNTGKCSKCAREKGTTVRISNLYKDCPLRRQILERGKKNEIIPITILLRSYCLISPVKITCFFDHQPIFCEQGNTPISLLQRRYPDHFKPNYLCFKNNKIEFILGSKSYKNKESQYIFLDKRMIKNTRISKMIINTFNMFLEGNPIFVLILYGRGDVNLSVDKTEVILNEEKEIMSAIRNKIIEYFNRIEHPIELKSQSSQLEFKNNNIRLESSYSKRNYKEENIIKKENEEENIIKKEKNIMKGRISLREIMPNYTSNNDITPSFNTDSRPISHSDVVPPSFPDIRPSITTNNISLNNTPLPSSGSSNNTSSYSNDYSLLTPVIQKNIPIDYSSNIYSSQLIETDIDIPLSQPDFKFSIKKEDFRRMELIGQFNHGFILTRLVKNNTIFLIIVDQHAADEIKNYEMLVNSFSLRRQKLIVPVPLELSPIEKFIIKGNRNLLIRNGYEVDDNFHLTSVPIYKNEIFTKKDFFSILDEIDKGEVLCGKIKAMMASKACRSSVMIGEPLNNKKMKEIVSNLADLKRPWNCPHGRPTFKVLYSLPIV